MLVVDDKHGSNDFNESEVDDLVIYMKKKQQEEEWDIVLWEEEWKVVEGNGEADPKPEPFWTETYSNVTVLMSRKSKVTLICR